MNGFTIELAKNNKTKMAAMKDGQFRLLVAMEEKKPTAIAKIKYFGDLACE
ncbi:hypothetical protein GCM10027514_04670 [Azotobacter armeniacus]